MNLAESVKFVLKNKKQDIFIDFWSDDFKGILSGAFFDLAGLYQTGKSQVISLRQNKIQFRPTLRGVIDLGSDVWTVFKLTPKRVKNGFSIFRDEFIQELDNLPDQKQKSLFCLKVLAGLSKFAVSTIYSVKKSQSKFKLSGLRRSNTFIQMLIAEIALKISQMFVLRFITEIEKELSNSEDINRLKTFRTLISKGKKTEEAADINNAENDRAFQIVENLKNYILYGKEQADE